MALIDELAARLLQTTSDLEHEINHRYGDASRLYPSQLVRYQRDTAPVRAARALLADYEASKTSPQLDALLCELGAFGVRLDVLRGQ